MWPRVPHKSHHEQGPQAKNKQRYSDEAGCPKGSEVPSQELGQGQTFSVQGVGTSGLLT